MPDPERLLAEEAAGWAALRQVLVKVDPSRWREPTVTPEGWSVSDTVHHIGAWLDACGEVLESIAAGTRNPAAQLEETSGSVNLFNSEHVSQARALSVEEVEWFVRDARERARAGWSALSVITPDAWSWFEESGPMHYAKHEHDLRAWIAGGHSDPEVGALLQADAEGWVGFAGTLDAIPLGAWREPAPDGGWSPLLVAHHVLAWQTIVAEAVVENRDWATEVPVPEALLAEENARLVSQAAGAQPQEVRIGLTEAHGRLRAALASHPVPSEGAKRAFRANTAEHYAEHLGELRAARDRVVGAAG